LLARHILSAPRTASAKTRKAPVPRAR
jgi:hypothetical protein